MITSPLNAWIQQNLLSAKLAHPISIIHRDGRVDVIDAEAYSKGVLDFAKVLSKLGLQIGDSILIILENSIHWEWLEKASLLCGVAVAACETYALPSAIDRAIKSSHPRLVVVQNHDLLVHLDPPNKSSTRIIDLKELNRLSRDVTDDIPSTILNIPKDASAKILYTSGTTGEPKILTYTHEQYFFALSNIGKFFQATSAERTLCWLPMSSPFQRMMNMSTLFVNGKLWILTDPKAVMRGLALARPTVTIGVPRFYEKIYQKFSLNWSVRLLRLLGLRGLAHLQLKKNLGGQIKYLISGSAPCPMHVLDLFFSAGLPLFEAYGTSECILPIAANTLREHRRGSVGRPLPNQEVKISADGEILIKGPGVSTNQIAPDGFYHTKDLGYFDHDGFLYLTGRANDLVKTSTGKKVSLTSLEENLSIDPHIEQIVAHAENRPFAIALIYLKVGTNISSLVERVQEQNTRLEKHQRFGAILLLDRPLSVEQDELTTNLKYKRRTIYLHFSNELNYIYSSIDQVKVGTTNTFPESNHKWIRV